MPHGLLLSGPAGVGVEHLADAIALHALGEPPTEFPELKSHVLAHADLKCVEPERGRTGLSVDAIRELDAWVHLTPQLGSRKVVLLFEAERLTRAAGNAFLKTLEEPPLGSLLILLTHAPARLLPTIRSRLQLIEVKAPPVSEAIAWMSARHTGSEEGVIARHLFEAGGAPLAADQAISRGLPLLGPMFVAALSGRDQGKLVDCLCDLEADLWLSVWMRYCAQAMHPGSSVLNSESKDPERIWQFWCRLAEARRMLHQGITLNPRLTAGNLVAEWARLAYGAGS